MTKIGERILIGVPTTLLIILFISQIDWAKGPGNPGQLQDPGQIVLTDAGFLNTLQDSAAYHRNFLGRPGTDLQRK